MGKNHILENDLLLIEINDFGAELVRIYDKKNKREVLWDGNPDWWARHAPILFPFVGTCYQNQYHYKGDTYSMTGHGFARDKEMKCELEQENQVVHSFIDDEETRKNYPFSFCLKVTHTLKDRTILVSWDVMNTGEEDMYFSIGGHPAFMIPEGMEQRDCGLFFENKNPLTYLLIDEKSKGADTANPYTLETEQGHITIGEHRFEKDALIFENQQVEEVTLTLSDKTPYVTINCKGFPYMGIWSKPGAPFVCLEPWYGRCDNKEFTGDLTEKTGVNHLKPKAEFHAQYEIIIQ